MPFTAPDRTPLAVGGAAVATLGVALGTAAATGLTPALGITAVANVFLASRTMAGLPPRRRFAELPVVAVLVSSGSTRGWFRGSLRSHLNQRAGGVGPPGRDVAWRASMSARPARSRPSSVASPPSGPQPAPPQAGSIHRCRS